MACFLVVERIAKYSKKWFNVDTKFVMSEISKPLPSVRVAVTQSCNLRCDYCPTDGDSVEVQGPTLDHEGFERMLLAACEVGFTNFSFTGGEPLMTPKSAELTFDLANFVDQSRQSQGYTKLNTNGANLLRYREQVLNDGFDELKVSLDTLDPTTFKQLAKRGEQVLGRTIEGILAVKDEVPVRMQTVVGKYNVGELPQMIGFCRQNGLDIKLFDISRYDNALAGSGKFCDDNYVSLGDISSQLKQAFGEPEIVYAVGGYGHAKQVFTTPEGTRIQLRDTSVSAQYSSELC